MDSWNTELVNIALNDNSSCLDRKGCVVFIITFRIPSAPGAFFDSQLLIESDISLWVILYISELNSLLYPRPTKLEGGGGILDSPCPSVRLSVCRRHGFRSISQVCFGISISNFICMLMVAIGRSLLIFSDVTFKMAAWRPYWIFWFPD